MRQGFRAALGGAALLVAMCACAKPHPPAAKVVVGGEDLTVSQPVTCARKDNNLYIAMGQAPTVLSAVITDTKPAQVNAVVFDDVGGVTLIYRAGRTWTPAPGRPAMYWVAQRGWVQAPTVSVNGKSYTLAGTASGSDAASRPVSKDFRIDATCP